MRVRGRSLGWRERVIASPASMPPISISTLASGTCRPRPPRQIIGTPLRLQSHGSLIDAGYSAIAHDKTAVDHHRGRFVSESGIDDRRDRVMKRRYKRRLAADDNDVDFLARLDRADFFFEADRTDTVDRRHFESLLSRRCQTNRCRLRAAQRACPQAATYAARACHSSSAVKRLCL
jgi:hypothetical protein